MTTAQRKTKHDLTRRAYKATSSFLRGLRRLSNKNSGGGLKPGNGIKIAFIHNEKRISTGAHHINQIMANALREQGARIRNFYPRRQLVDAPIHMRGITNILFFHSLLEHKDNILRYHIIQGTTYTPLPFLSFNTPIVSHFGSTTIGFLKNTPRTSTLLSREQTIWHELKGLGVIPSLEPQTMRPLKDIADMEKLVATRVTKCIATSENVKNELINMGVSPDHVTVVHNAIEDYWFTKKEFPTVSSVPHIVFLGRLGGDVFTLKLKGLDRLIDLYRSFPDIPKTTICMTTNKKLKEWLKVAFPVHHMYVNMQKELISKVLSHLYGSILFICSRYEGFSLSLIEGMSQGLVPIAYFVGVAPEIIQDGKNGFLVSSNEEAQKRITELLSNPAKRLAMAKAAQKTSTKFCSKTIANKLFDVYREIKTEQNQKKVYK